MVELRIKTEKYSAAEVTVKIRGKQEARYWLHANGRLQYAGPCNNTSFIRAFENISELLAFCEARQGA